MALPLPAGSCTRSHASQLRVVHVGLALTTRQCGLDCASGIRRFGWVRGQQDHRRVDPFTRTSSQAARTIRLTWMSRGGSVGGDYFICSSALDTSRNFLHETRSSSRRRWSTLARSTSLTMNIFRLLGSCALIGLAIPLTWPDRGFGPPDLHIHPRAQDTDN